MASKHAARSRAEELRKELARHDQLYFVEGRPVINDAEYDRLFQELLAIEGENPELVFPHSPTQRVGAPLPEGSGFSQVRHEVPMLSIDSLFDSEKVREFEQRITNFLKLESGAELAWVVEPKFDGVSASVLYEKGVLTRGLTRGDGLVGEDVTANLRTVRNLPLRLVEEHRTPPEILEVRGEVLMELNAFRAFNLQREAQRRPTLANARNATAGALRRNDPAEVARYPLLFYPWGVPRWRGTTFTSHWEQLQALHDFGLTTSPYTRKVQGLEPCLAYRDELQARRPSLPFEVDGVVAKLDSLNLRERLGSTARSTRWQFAYKFPAGEALSLLRAIELQVGAYGRITPRAHIDPVEIGGVTVRHSTLHNAAHVESLGLSVGDRVFLRRAGDVIPQISGVAESSKGARPSDWKQRLPEEVLADGRPRTGVLWRWRQKFQMPSHCPACNVALIAEGKYWRCPNTWGCPPQLIGRTLMMTGRSGFAIDRLGERMLEQLFDIGLLKSPADVFHLEPHRERLLELERWGEKTLENLFAEIATRRCIPFQRFLAALGIPQVGPATARLLSLHFARLEDLAAADLDALVEIEGIGPEMAGSIRNWFQDAESRALLERLASGGVEIVFPDHASGTQGRLAGKTVVFTGTLTRMTRAEAKHLVESAGGRVGSSVNAKTHYVVVGDSPGAKARKAKELGVPILPETEFQKLLASGA